MIDYNALCKRIDEMEEQYIEFWKEFCEIESPTDYKKGVDAASNYIVEKAKAYGWRIERQEQKVSGDCICITLNPDAKQAPLCLSGHIDTVHPVGSFGTPAVRFDDEKIYGPGVSDCKGGIVVAFFAMAVLYEAGYRTRPIKLIIQSDEETGSLGSKKSTVQFMCECAKDAVAFLNCEPCAPGIVVLKRNGIAKYTFKITGKAAPSARCFDGVSAVTEAAHKILELEKYKDKKGITANCGIVSGGTTVNTVPEKCTINVDFRFSNSEEFLEVQRISRKVADHSWVEGTTCELVLENMRDAMELVDKNLDLLERVNEILELTNLPKLTYSSARGGSDATYTTKCGIPTLDSFGVEGGSYHSKDEFAYISSLKKAAKKIVAICCYID